MPSTNGAHLPFTGSLHAPAVPSAQRVHAHDATGNLSLSLSAHIAGHLSRTDAFSKHSSSSCPWPLRPQMGSSAIRLQKPPGQ